MLNTESTTPTVAKDIKFEYAMEFDEFRVAFGLFRDRLIYRIKGREKWNGSIEDQMFHDTFRQALHRLFEENFIYGRAVDKKTMQVIEDLLSNQIGQPPPSTALIDAVFPRMVAAQWIKPSRRDLRRFRYLEDGVLIGS